MAADRDDPTIRWLEPVRRGVIPLDRFHVPRSLRKTLRREPFTLRVDTAFPAVIETCAEPTPERPRTWLNDALIEVYIELHRRGYAHSVEAWSGDRLVGGLYGLKLGRAYFGESMFSRATDASKVCLVELVARMRTGGFQLLDTQFLTEHLSRFGAIEISRFEYRRLLTRALAGPARWPARTQPFWPELVGSGSGSGSGSAQSSTQTS
jgi:leucyl/phenylalanyl-tRNA--protein transferase